MGNRFNITLSYNYREFSHVGYTDLRKKCVARDCISGLNKNIFLNFSLSATLLKNLFYQNNKIFKLMP